LQTVIISSPGFTPKDFNPIVIASVPEFVAIQCFDLTKLANCFSKLSTIPPKVKFEDFISFFHLFM